MKNLIKRIIGKKITINAITSIDQVEVLEIHRIIHDRSDWTIVVADIKLVLNGVTMILPIHSSIRSQRAKRDSWYNIQYTPLDYRGTYLLSDITSTETNDYNTYTIPKDILPQLLAYVIPFIKATDPKIIYR